MEGRSPRLRRRRHKTPCRSVLPATVPLPVLLAELLPVPWAPPAPAPVSTTTFPPHAAKRTTSKETKKKETKRMPRACWESPAASTVVATEPRASGEAIRVSGEAIGAVDESIRVPGESIRVPGEAIGFPVEAIGVPREASAFRVRRSAFPSRQSAFPLKEQLSPLKQPAFPG